MAADYPCRSSRSFDFEVNFESEHFESNVYQISEGNSDRTRHLNEEQRKDLVISKAIEIENNGAIAKKYSHIKMRYAYFIGVKRLSYPSLVDYFRGECFRMFRVFASPV